MLTSCSSWSHHRTIDAGKLDQMSWLDECASLGLDGVELLFRDFPSTDRDYLIQLKKACADRYLEVAMVSAAGHLTVSDDQQRADDVDAIRDWADVAVFLGAPRVRFFAGSGAELDAGGDELYRKVVDAMRQVAAIGAERGVTMCLENHGNTTAEQVLALLKDVDSEFLKFTLDTGNFPPHSQVHDGTYESIERCAPYAAIVHAKFFHVLEDGRDRDFDWERIRKILDGVGFRGFLSIEYEGPDDNELGCIRRIAPYLHTLR